jgi:transcription initiation factor TFIIE subunit alpha
MKQETKLLSLAMKEKDIEEIVGIHALQIVKYLEGKQDISEFRIAEDLKIEIHAIRNLLYKLHGSHLVTYIRKKDRIKGWYISYWTLNLARFKEMLPIVRKNNLKKIKKRLLDEKKNQFYLCKNMCSRMNFESAMDLNFKCQECGELMNFQDNSRTIEFLNNKILELEEQIV